METAARSSRLVGGPFIPHNTHHTGVVRSQAEAADVLLQRASIQLIPDQTAVQAGMGVLVVDEDGLAENRLEESP